jgi:SET domain-containing protein
MLLVSTYLATSPIHGIGLFAAQVIAADARIWKRDHAIDISLTEEQLQALPQPCRNRIWSYCYKQRRTGLYVLCGDDARFFNHSATPNCVDRKDDDGAGVTLAKRDIAVGEELTCDYSIIDQDYIDGIYRL